jgi:hypothetical protein
VHAVISNLGAPAIELADGEPTGPAIATGGVLWKGACTLIAASTTSHLESGRKPPALAEARGDCFRLRCADAGRLAFPRRTPGAFRAGYPSGRARDFLCDHVQIELEEEVAVEAGGELLGRRRQLEISLCDPVTVAALADGSW